MTTYYEKNREERLKKANDYYKNNKEKVKEYQQDFRSTEESKEYQHEWRKKNIERRILLGAQNRAKKKNIECSLVLEDIIIPDLCPILGIQLKKDNKGHAQDSSPSIDRIDSKKGYIKNNIRIISFRANTIKNNATIEELELVLKDARNIIQLPK